mmetsp:Transcript_99185/g.285301  ORF Transcript_99185/g.285301 Transcript_99185/m.285301 type:complete len:234 (+) Transcript_99185:1108-1809(+)
MLNGFAFTPPVGANKVRSRACSWGTLQSNFLNSKKNASFSIGRMAPNSLDVASPSAALHIFSGRKAMTLPCSGSITNKRVGSLGSLSNTMPVSPLMPGSMKLQILIRLPRLYSPSCAATSKMASGSSNTTFSNFKALMSPEPKSMLRRPSGAEEADTQACRKFKVGAFDRPTATTRVPEDNWPGRATSCRFSSGTRTSRPVPSRTVALSREAPRLTQALPLSAGSVRKSRILA